MTVVTTAKIRVARRATIVRELHELIAAIDRRVPQVHRMAEVRFRQNR